MNEFQSNVGNCSTLFDSSSREEPVLGTRDCLAMDFMASNKPTYQQNHPNFTCLLTH